MALHKEAQRQVQINVFCLAGFSDKTLETLKHLDSDQAAFLRQIESIEL